MKGFDWGHFRSAFAGLLVGALLLSAPAVSAAIGDAVRAGQQTNANATTTVKGNSPATLKLVNTRPNEEALRLHVKPGSPPMWVSSTAKVPRLNADRLDGNHANALIRADACGKDDGLHSADFSCSMTITAPDRGYLIMSGSVDVWRSDPGADLMHCKFTLNGENVIGSTRAMDNRMPGNQEANCATDASEVVAAGTHTIVMHMVSVNSPTRVAEVGAWVLYVPFGGNGARPTASP